MGLRLTAAQRLSRCTAVVYLSAVMLAGTFSLVPEIAAAQYSDGSFFGSRAANPDAQMLLEADQVIYNNDDETVTAVGNVQISYDNYTLTAQRVTFSRATGRVIANGNVEILEPTGERIFAEEIDITDDFSDGFVSSLQVETADNTRFAAESAERRDGEISVFTNGVYTACEPCKEDPERPPLWQIRANRVIINNRTQRVEYEGASFELFGRPIAYLPRFSHADPAIRRMSGFLVPTLTYTETLGMGVGESFFWAIAPHYDLTATGTYYTNQGFLSEVEWRHRLANGQYSIRFANIDQQHPEDFDANTIDSHQTDRSAVMTTGRFQINPRWTFGWNALWQTDKNFSRSYNLTNFNQRDVTNEIYLTGLAGKNFFDLRAEKFLIQDDRYWWNGNPADGRQNLQEQQGNALPIFDYNRVSGDPVAGGQVSLDVNVQNIYRHEPQLVNWQDDGPPDFNTLNNRWAGIAGNWTRASAESEWKRSEIFNGAVVTASLSGRGDGIFLNTDALNTTFNPLTSNDTLWRGMAAGMLEIRYPLIATDGFATHLFEPIAQVIVRPDETHIGEFPNEDAQSFVFDTANLFERDKFSGYDRVEGGTRANVGFRYSATYLNGATLNIMAGESFQLAGLNSFAQRDLVNAGLESGLETARSDFVVSANVNNGNGMAVGVGGRFDEKDLEFKRGEVSGRYVNDRIALTGNYVFIASQPNYSGYVVTGNDTDRHEANGSASIKLSEYWRAFGSASFDIEEGNLYSRGIGIAYDDSCFSFSVAYREEEDRYTGLATDTSVLFRFGLRTIGDYDYKYSLSDDEPN